MAKETPSPVSFRLSPEDRALVETVAAYRHQTVSDFVRSVVVSYANHVVQTEGRDKILRTLAEANDRLKEERLEVWAQAVDQAGARRPG